MIFGRSLFALIVRSRAPRSTRGTNQAKEYPENMMVNTWPSKTKDTLCISYSRRFLPVPSILAAARSASSWSSSLLFYCFAANRKAVLPKTLRQRQHAGCENTFAVTLAVNKNQKQNKAKYYEQT